MYDDTNHPHDPEHRHPNPRDDAPRTVRGLLVYLAAMIVVLGVAVAMTNPVVVVAAVAGAVVGLVAGAAVVRRLEEARAESAASGERTSPTA